MDRRVMAAIDEVTGYEFFHANQREALNQSLAEISGQINVSFEFFRRVPVKWKTSCGTQSIV